MDGMLMTDEKERIDSRRNSAIIVFIRNHRPQHLSVFLVAENTKVSDCSPDICHVDNPSIVMTSAKTT